MLLNQRYQNFVKNDVNGCTVIPMTFRAASGENTIKLKTFPYTPNGFVFLKLYFYFMVNTHDVFIDIV